MPENLHGRASISARVRGTVPPEELRLSAQSRPVGKIVEIKGVVLDAVFPDHLPAIYNALEIKLPAGPDSDGAHPDRRGAAAPRRRARPRGGHGRHRRPRARHGGRRHGRADQRAGRRGDARPHLQRARRADRQEARTPVEDAQRWPIHREPPAFDELSPTAEIFETGIKVIDLLAPVRQGRQDRPLRRRRRGQDGADPGAHPQHRHRSTAACRCSPAWASAPARATTSSTRWTNPA